jgi:hypothetical protein
MYSLCLPMNAISEKLLLETFPDVSKYVENNRTEQIVFFKRKFHKGNFR